MIDSVTALVLCDLLAGRYGTEYFPQKQGGFLMETGLEYGLIGAKLGHSFSPEIHAKIGHYPYELRELSPDGVHHCWKNELSGA